MDMPGQQKEMHVYDYLRVLYKWRRVATICFLIIVGTVSIGSFLMTPVYRATTRILIERESPKILTMQEIIPVDTSTTEFYQTQYKLLQSRSLALRVIKAMNLSQNSVFNPQIGLEQVKQDKKTVESLLVGRFLNNLKVDPIRNSRLVDLSYEFTDPALAADIANMFAKGYIEQSMGWKSETSNEARDFLSKQLEEQKKNLEESEQALQKYKEQYGIIQLTPFAGDKDRENIAMQRLAGLTAGFVSAQSSRIEAEARFKEVQDLLAKGASYESIPQISSDYQIQRLRENEAKLITQVSELSQKYGEKHPRMVQLRKELESTRENMKEESKRIINSIKNEFAIAKAKEDNARRAMEGQKAETQKLSERAIQYSVLYREVEKNRELYENLLKRLKETTVAGEMGTTNIRIVDHAEVPRSPAKPKKVQNIFLSLVVGLFMGIGLAFFFEYMDNTIKIPEDIQKYVQTSCIALIPTINFKEEIGTNVENQEMIVYHKPKSNIAEAFRSLRTAILFSFPENPPKSLVVTSFVPREGKTFISTNLALIMAYSGESVLLIDADMRKPQVHKMLKLNNEKGLSNFIIGEEAVIQTSMMHEKLSAITSGPIPPNPAELLGSKKMMELIESMKTRYDRIIIDSPPVSSVTDAVLLSKLVDGAIFVVHGGVTTKNMAIQGSTTLRDVNAKIVGAILNNIDIGKESYYYSHYYHYYYYYDHYYQEDDGDKRRSSGRRNRENSKSPVWAFLNKPIGGKKTDRTDKGARP